jgi:mono/diheme cytochrome c family protein
MRDGSKQWLIVFLFFVAVVFVLPGGASAAEASFTWQMSTDVPVDPDLPSMPPEEDGWVILPDLGEDATQADYGSEVYRLVCKACHGDRGQGLTREFRMTWAPEDQNCWQAKCHLGNHPPEGFVLPRFVPAIMESSSLSEYETALDLFNYIHDRMPWHNPGSMTETEVWQVVAYILREMDIDPGTEPIDAERAATIQINSSLSISVPSEPTPTVQETNSPPREPANNAAWWPALAAGVVFGSLILLVWLLRRHRS